jgi:hypothetical protein
MTKIGTGLIDRIAALAVKSLIASDGMKPMQRWRMDDTTRASSGR